MSKTELYYPISQLHSRSLNIQWEIFFTEKLLYPLISRFCLKQLLSMTKGSMWFTTNIYLSFQSLIQTSKMLIRASIKRYAMLSVILVEEKYETYN